MAALGFLPLIDQPHRAPIIITFAPRPDAACDAAALAEALAERGLVIYPSKHWRRDSFRVGVIGAIGEDDIDDLLAAIGDYRAAAGQDRHRAVRHET
ncbi:hypothetical protein [Azospirillum thermophilum]|uniref:hypothetical protein n=1 Tax=Azospirillum thermophilum TaxID=2202148 RepID=UPI001FE96AEA|nr:hypothetical protein [Azospirillum thermophilum]